MASKFSFNALKRLRTALRKVWLLADHTTTFDIEVERAEKIPVGSGIGYVSWNQDRVRVGFTRCGLAKSPQYSQACVREYGIGSQAIDQAAIFRIFSPQGFCTHRVNGTINEEKLAILHIRTFAHHQVRYLRSGFAHLLPDVSGSGVRSTPTSIVSHNRCIV